MRKCFMGAVIATAAIVACAGLVLAQGQGGRGRGGQAPQGQQQQGRGGGGGQQGIPCVNHWQRPDGCQPRTGTHNPRDLSGVWQRVRGGANMGDAATALLTPLGKKIYEEHKPGFGPRAGPPAFGNDPMGNCDPLGLTRNVFTEIGARTFEFAHLPDRALQFFEWAHQYRTIWTDGRQLPKDPEPRWMGYSVGRWEGDTFIVDSVGLDDRNWADMWGHPLTSKVRVQERYRRTGFDTLELQMTITDLDAYTKPWVSDTKVHRIQVEKGMDERLETFCVPSEEQAFNKSIRDPAGGVNVPK